MLSATSLFRVMTMLPGYILTGNIVLLTRQKVSGQRSMNLSWCWTQPENLLLLTMRMLTRGRLLLQGMILARFTLFPATRTETSFPITRPSRLLFFVINMTFKKVRKTALLLTARKTPRICLWDGEYISMILRWQVSHLTAQYIQPLR